MIGLIIALLFGIVVFISIRNIFRKPEAFLKINFIDYQDINFYSEISLKINDKTIKKLIIDKKSAIIGIYGFKNIETLKGELILSNRTLGKEKKFTIILYRNILNININNTNKDYYDSEIIFYFEKAEQIIEVKGLEYSNHNQKYRQRLLIYNTNENMIKDIIIQNNINEEDKKKAISIIEKNNNKLLLFNIYLGINKNTILIFLDSEKPLIVPSKEEKNLFQNYYHEMYSNKEFQTNLNLISEKYKRMLINKGIIFGQRITNLDDDKDSDVIFSVLNQGLNSLFYNNIISKNSLSDFEFILGNALFFYYIDQKGINASLVKNFFDVMIESNKRISSYPDLIRIGVSYIIFRKNKKDNLTIMFTEKLEMNNYYKNGFEFFKDIINDLNEDSDLIFIYLQINSGYGLELMNNETCFKLSMIPVETVKEHIIEIIPKYFYVYDSDKDEYISTDSRTQIAAFNQNKIVDKSNNNSQKKSEMNITIGMFHESGHEKYHMNTDVGGDRSPKNCISKSFEFIKKTHWERKERGESGKFVDYFLYKSDDEFPINIMSSGKSIELMNKSYFTGNLTNLNTIANNIASSLANNNNQNKLGNRNNQNNIVSALKFGVKSDNTRQTNYTGSKTSDVDY
jgi:hypothetical protein